MAQVGDGARSSVLVLDSGPWRSAWHFVPAPAPMVAAAQERTPLSESIRIYRTGGAWIETGVFIEGPLPRTRVG